MYVLRGKEAMGAFKSGSFDHIEWAVQCDGRLVATSRNTSCLLCGQPDGCLKPVLAAEERSDTCCELYGQYAQLPREHPRQPYHIFQI